MKIQSKLGNETLMQREKTAFLCSRKTPDGLEYLVGKWILGLDEGRDCIMCGNQSAMERAVFTTLLQRRIPTILCLAEAMPSRWGDDVREALAAGRLLVVTHCDASVHSVTARSAFDRNVLMMSLAQKIVVGCCTKGGKLERALAGFDNVEYLANGQPWLDHMELINNPPAEKKPEPTRLSRWGRVLKLRRGTIFLDFNDSGPQTFFKITHSVTASDGGYCRQKMFFDRKELTAFSGAVDFLLGKMAKGEGVPPGLTVASLSGDITFSEQQDAGIRMLSMTQAKDLVGGVHRVNTVTLAFDELPMLAKGVEDALETW